MMDSKYKKKDDLETADPMNWSVVDALWSLTPQLRWKQKEVDMADGTVVNTSELQQMWRSNSGEEKWEAVPFVE